MNEQRGGDDRSNETLVSKGEQINAQKSEIPDRGRRRHLSWGMDFDTRSLTLDQEIADHWEDRVKELHQNNKIKAREGLVAEFGELGIDGKIENFIAIDTKPFSTLGYHNRMFHQVRQSYVIGAYYPALVAACALGERILNHLIIDLRKFYKTSPEYKKIYRKDSFANWDLPINTLDAWGVLLPEVVEEFLALKNIRHRSIHFNMSTYQSLKDDALAAILCMRAVIEKQFGSHGPQPWFLKGTKGHLFIARDYEENPFVQTYYLPNCPFVGPHFSMAYGDNGWKVIDYPDYGEGEWSDEEFAGAFEARSLEDLARMKESEEGGMLQ
ncbi:hypothetical protein [Parasphingorhabdus sp.]|uniref:hypothetical protein n=1 Tax=Parasphingorhabdus sp. TaxID=2709688 RepID=UPI003A907D5A